MATYTEIEDREEWAAEALAFAHFGRGMERAVEIIAQAGVDIHRFAMHVKHRIKDLRVSEVDERLEEMTLNYLLDASGLDDLSFYHVPGPDGYIWDLRSSGFVDEILSSESDHPDAPLARAWVLKHTRMDPPPGRQIMEVFDQEGAE